MLSKQPTDVYGVVDISAKYQLEKALCRARRGEVMAASKRGKKLQPTEATMRAIQLNNRERLDFENLDPGIQAIVRVLWENAVETCQSCQGGKGHAYAEPTVQFLGGPGAGFEALGIAMLHGLKVTELRRVWELQYGEPAGPTWMMTFKSEVK